MVKIAEHKKKIEEIDRQLSLTKSRKRRHDLLKHRQRLLIDLRRAERFLGMN